MTTPHVLTGPDGSTPLGLLVALGVFRLLSRRGKAAALAWVQAKGAWRPVIHGTAPSTATFQGDLADALAADSTPSFTGLDREKVKVEPERYRTWARSAQARQRSDPDLAAWAACLGSDLSLLGKGTVRPTAWDMTSGQQQFLGMGADLAQAFAATGMGQTISQHLEETLWGPWRGSDQQHPLGWDSDREAVYALAASDPSKMKVTTTAGAIRLAFAALPFFPVWVDDHARLRTLGFGSWRQSAPFVWPLWGEPLDPDTISGLLAIDGISSDGAFSQRQIAALKGRGIVAICRAMRAPMGDKGYAILRPATTVWEDVPTAA